MTGNGQCLGLAARYGQRVARRLNRFWLKNYQPIARTIYSFQGITIGSNTIVHPKASLQNHHGKGIWIGRHSEVLQYACLWTYGGSIELGDYTSINPFCVLYGHGGLRIGNRVKIACHTVFIPANHNISDPERPIMEQGLTCKGIVVEDDVWIGAGVRVLDGVRIAAGSVIGAGSVVTKSLEKCGVYVGVPAKFMRPR
jgi:acetyltransferase-like isoleucine patch superfamily enzyme